MVAPFQHPFFARRFPASVIFQVVCCILAPDAYSQHLAIAETYTVPLTPFSETSRADAFDFAARPDRPEGQRTLLLWPHEPAAFKAAYSGSTTLALPLAPNSIDHTWVAGAASWFVNNNWSPSSQPAPIDNAFVNNGGTAQVAAGTANANVITLGQNSGDSGTLSLGLNGILLAGQVRKGAGVGTVTFDGGTLRANADNVSLLSSFGASGNGDVTISANNAYIDTNGFSVSSEVAMNGAGSLFKEGTGTLVLSGDYSNLSGGVTVHNGTLSVIKTLSLYPRTLLVAPLAGGSANLEVSAAGRINASNVNIGGGANSNTVANVASGGTISVIGVSVASTGTATLNVNGGSVATEDINIGVVSGTHGTVNVYSGSADAGYAGISVGTKGGTGILNVYGGTASGAFVNIGGLDSSANVYGGVLRVGSASVASSNSLSLFDGSVNIMRDATISGTTNIVSGTFQVGGVLTVDAGGVLNLTGGSVQVDQPRSRELASATLNVGEGAGAGALSAQVRGSGTSTVNFNHTGTVQVSLPLIGSLQVNKLGSGTTILEGVSTYTGSTTVNAGSLLVNGSITSPITVNGGSLGGSGTTGAVTINSGGTLTPGNSPGILNVVGTLSLNQNSTYFIELNDPTLGMQYDQTNVTGSVTLSDPILSLQVGFSPVIGTSFTIINNDSSDSILGTFKGLGEGETLSAGGSIFSISYVGNTGNDVVLTAVPELSTLWSVLGGGLGVMSYLRLRASKTERIKFLPSHQGEL